MRHRSTFGAALAAFLLPAAAQAQVEYDYIALMRQMFNLNTLPNFLDPAVTVGQFSSTDPASKIVNGQKVAWFSNRDHGNFLRQDPEGHVLAEMNGPGMVTRIWCGNPQGVFKLFIDRQEAPTLTADFEKLFLGHYDPITRPFATVRARGGNLYLPIAYQRHCRIVVENPGDMYYQVTYRNFMEDTKVQSWQFDRILQQDADSMRWIVQRLIDDPIKVKGQAIAGPPKTVKPGEKYEVTPDIGPAEIQSFYVEVTAPDLAKALREVLLTINFDEAKEPQVWAPLGDFFGSGPGANSYITVPMGVDANKFYCKFRMPYKHLCEIVFSNEGNQNVDISAWTRVSPYREIVDVRAYFHAKWRRTYPNTSPEWTVADIRGHGHYLGTMLSVWNPKQEWWGEGDDRFYIDGSPTPTLHGTGTEDYFGAAMADSTIFDHPYLAQTLCEGPNHSGYTSFLRWHTFDLIPFQKSLKFTLENYGEDKEYASTSYWYADWESTDDFKPVPVKERIPRPLRAGFAVAGGFEGERLLLLASSEPEPKTSKQSTLAFDGRWSMNEQLVWTASGVGQWIDLGGVLAEPGKYELVFYGTRGKEYGIVQFSMSGKKLGQPLDGYAEKTSPTGPISLGEIELEPNALPKPLRVEMIGKNDKATAFAFGVDVIELKKK
jgi:hypothetical protein